MFLSKTKKKACGRGKVKMIMNGHPVLLEDVYHLPLSGPSLIFLAKQHASTTGCSVDIDEFGVCIIFLAFLIRSDSLHFRGSFSLDVISSLDFDWQHQSSLTLSSCFSWQFTRRRCPINCFTSSS